MIVDIGAPPVRSLNENEKRAYKLLREGKTPFEVAQIMHIPYRASYLINVHDVPATSVQGIISSIREKGWEIPAVKADEENEEEDDMNKYGSKVKGEALKLHVDGVSNNEIAERLGVAYKTVWKWVHDLDELPIKQMTNIDSCAVANATKTVANFAVACENFVKCAKEEPAPSANDTSSHENENIPAISINPAHEFVKPVSSGVIQDVVLEALLQKAEEQRENDNLIKHMKEQLASIEAHGELLQYEHEELSVWYDYISKEADYNG